jgi:hypothetical protein
MLGFAVFCDMMAVVVAACLRDRARLERLTDLYSEVVATIAAMLVGVFRRRDTPPPVPPPDIKQLQ